MRYSFLALLASFYLAVVPPSSAAEDWSKVAAALGKSGTEMPGDVYRVGLPRTDLHVTLDGVDLKAGFALGSWVAFRPEGKSAMVMGDLVLTESEIPPVMSKLAEDGIEITALHNHLLRAQPPTFFMHVLGHGDPQKLAAALHDGLVLSKAPLGDTGQPVMALHDGSTVGKTQPGDSGAAASTSIDLDTALLDRTLRAKGRANGGVYQYGIPRAKPVKDAGMEVPVAMGSAEAINFQPTGNGKAAITGDFVLTASEVNPVLRALRQNGIEVTALHNHMLNDEPRLFFMHFWAVDDAGKLATGLRAALDKVDVAHGS
jgi:hypothetical protein